MNLADFLSEKNTSKKSLAVIGDGQSVSYKDLWQKILFRSNYLLFNFGNGKKILLLADNGLFFIESYLAILKSGNAVVLIETQVGQKEIDGIMNQVKPSLVIAQEKYSKIILKDSIILTEKEWGEISNSPLKSERSVKSFSSKNDLAEIIYTSGSTGTKKGVMLSHSNIIANTRSIIKYLKLSSKDKIAVVMPFSYCYGLSLLHTHLRVGGTVVLHQKPFLGAVIKLIEEKECTGFAGVPATYQILMAKTDFLKHSFPQLRYMTQAGGKLENRFIKILAEAFPQKNFFVMYGATEASARLSYLPPKFILKKLGSIGKGIPGVILKVVSEKGKKVKVGQTGEIIAKGKNIMVGYYRDKKGTDSVLKKEWYYTGDLATVDKDGFIYVAGRKKNIIKSAGHRISPYEIEEVINNVPDISKSVTVGLPDNLLGEAPTVLAETKKPSSFLSSKITEACRLKLPSYKIPRHIIFTENIPMTPSNKIDLVAVKNYCLKYINGK